MPRRRWKNTMEGDDADLTVAAEAAVFYLRTKLNNVNY